MPVGEFAIASISHLPIVKMSVPPKLNSTSTQNYPPTEDPLPRIAANVPGVLFQFCWHPDGSVTFPYISPNGCTLLGLDAAAIQADSQAFICAIHQPDAASFQDSLAVSVQTGQTWRWQGRLRLPSGILTWVQLLAQPEWQPGGKVFWDGLMVPMASPKLETPMEGSRDENEPDKVGTNGVRSAEIIHELDVNGNSDRVTKERHTAQLHRRIRQLQRDIQALKRVENTLKLTQFSIDGAAEAILWIQPDARLFYANQGACRFLGYSLEELLSMSVLDLDVDLSPEVWPQYWQQFKQQGDFQVESHYRTKEGRIFPVEVLVNYIEFEGQEYHFLRVRHLSTLTQAEAERQKLVALIENSSDFIGLATLEGQPLFVNAAGCQLVGLPNVEAAKAVHVMDFFLPEDRVEVEQQILPILMQQGFWQGEYRFRHFETQEAIPVDFNWFVVKQAETGEPLCLASISRDIRDRQRTEEVLRSSEQDLRTIFDSAYDAIFVHDLDGNILDVNQKMLEMFGISREQAIDLTIPQISSSNSPVDQLPEIWQRTRAGKKLLFEWQVQHPGDGHRFDVEVFLQRVHLNARDIILATVRDISDRKRDQKLLTQQIRLTKFRADVDMALTRSETLLEMLRNFTDAVVEHLDAALARIWMLKPEDNILELRASSGLYTHIDGVHADISVGQLKIGLIAEEGCPHFTNDVQHDPYVSDKAWAKREGMVAFVGFPLLVEDQLLGVLAMFSRHPVSESILKSLGSVADEIALGIKRKQADEALKYSELQLRKKAALLEQTLQELQQTQMQLIQSEKMSSLGQLVAGVAHEINNPVNFIYGNLTHTNDYAQDLLGLLELYQQHYPNPVTEIQAEIEALDLDFLIKDLPKLIKSMKFGANRIKTIVSSLKTFSRMDEAELKTVNIHEGIDSSLMILKNRLNAQPDRAEIQVLKQYGDFPEVHCYAGQLNQVFLNILTNAIDAIEVSLKSMNHPLNKNPPFYILNSLFLKPSIRIRTVIIDNSWVEIRIADSGIGIPESIQTRIFDPFFTTKPVGKGIGLGLSISYQIVSDRHGGLLDCISEPGQGTEFVMMIPLHQKP